MNVYLKNKKGFTLVEMLISISLFIVVVTISIGALVLILDANRKAQSSKTIVDNLNLAIENMARNIRFGTKYHCGIDSDGDYSVPKYCDNGDTFLAVNFEGKTVVYSWEGINHPIQISYDNGVPLSITAPEVKIEELRFYAIKENKNQQPYVVVVIKGYSGNKPTSQTKFSIETMMSQRALDI